MDLGDPTPDPSRQVFVYLTAASLSLNLCVLLYGGKRRLVGAVRASHRGRHRTPHCLPVQAGKDKTNQDTSAFVSSAVTGLVTILMAAGALLSTAVASHPFVYHGDKEFILVVCSATIGRYLFLLALTVYFRHTRPRDRYVMCLHHVATLACYVTVTSCGANLFLPLLAVFMELDHFIHDARQLMRRRKPAFSGAVIQVVNVTGLLTALCFRVVLPIAGGALAVTRQHPLMLDAASLGVLCFGVFFFAVFNIWIIRRWAMYVLRNRSAGNKHLPLINTDGRADNPTHLNRKSIRNDLTTARKPTPSSSSSCRGKGELLLTQITKKNNMHTVSNLQSNFSNQAWSKDAHTVTRIGGVKAAEVVVGVDTVDANREQLDPPTEVVVGVDSGGAGHTYPGDGSGEG